jgi:hypothetical protein
MSAMGPREFFGAQRCQKRNQRSGYNLHDFDALGSSYSCGRTTRSDLQGVHDGIAVRHYAYLSPYSIVILTG